MFIAGITTSSVTGADVVVNGSGRLGVVTSSARYKRDINDMGASTDQLLKLRPVTFRYKDDPQAIKQYGLVAEEVAKVYPELVVHDEDGKVQSVRYSMLTSMLLNELQKEARVNQQQAELIERLNSRIAQHKVSTEQRVARLEAEREKDAAKRAALEARLASLEEKIVALHEGVKVQDAFNR